jgi:hypothetical protein
MKAEPTKDSKKRIIVDVNELFHIELHKKIRDDRTTISQLVRLFLEQYLDGKFNIAR